ncbi:MAG: ribosome-associated translation inhibitor RaiA [Bdellovibrionales bacterium]|nr:ribosome-associated translation inhibitor RaiA [Bdellovibrionales bacterium]
MVQSRVVNLNITFRNTESTEAIKTYAQEKISNCLKKYIHHDVEVYLVLLIEKNRHIADISFHVDGADFTCKEESENLYASIDKLVSALGNQMRKHKEKLTSHHAQR